MGDIEEDNLDEDRLSLSSSLSSLLLSLIGEEEASRSRACGDRSRDAADAGLRSPAPGDGVRASKPRDAADVE